MAVPVAIERTGLVTSVGLSAPAACAAIRAKLTNPTETRFLDPAGKWLMAHEVPLDKPWRGLPRLVGMAAMAIEECLADVPRDDWSRIPLLLCVAEPQRPGRQAGLDDRLFEEIQRALGVRFAAASNIVPHGRVGMAVAVDAARRLLQSGACERVLVAATDSLISWPTLSAYVRDDRLLSEGNSNGFLPGEAGAAVLLRRAGSGRELHCVGIGFGVEPAHIESDEPLRAQGLTAALSQALNDAGRQMHDVDFRITDLSGEQYYFKEATLALSRTLRQRKETFDIWHPAECIGETGAAAGLAVLAVADAAYRKGYAQGPLVMTHLANDAGQRAAVLLHYPGPT